MNYGDDGILAVSIDTSDYKFNKNEIFIIDYKLCNLISNEQWNSIMEDKKTEIFLKKNV